MASEELKPCPFCGGEVEALVSKIPRRVACRIECENCWIDITREGDDITGIDTVKALTIAAWNTRNFALVDAAQGWRPIETAPKDGSLVSCYTAENRVTDCFWDNPYWRDERGLLQRPTYWIKQPLPAAPGEQS